MKLASVVTGDRGYNTEAPKSIFFLEWKKGKIVVTVSTGMLQVKWW